MVRIGLLAGLLLLGLAAPGLAQLPGSPPGGFGAQGAKKSGDDLFQQSSNPGVAPPLDIRIQGEGISLPKGVADDDAPVKAQAEPKKADDPPSAATAKPQER